MTTATLTYAFWSIFLAELAVVAPILAYTAYRALR